MCWNVGFLPLILPDWWGRVVDKSCGHLECWERFFLCDFSDVHWVRMSSEIVSISFIKCGCWVYVSIKYTPNLYKLSRVAQSPTVYMEKKTPFHRVLLWLWFLPSCSLPSVPEPHGFPPFHSDEGQKKILRIWVMYLMRLVCHWPHIPLARG